MTPVFAAEIRRYGSFVRADCVVDNTRFVVFEHKTSNHERMYYRIELLEIYVELGVITTQIECVMAVVDIVVIWVKYLI